ncbi:antitoxin [Actinocrispum sp. NPDC049592]|uniref:antitoxin n=1 Tax=Actinocrispum sp. NPDC049592 TaxID=3154835 RepID=UPI003449A33B
MAKLFRKVAVLAGAAEAARRYARKNPEKVGRMAENAGRFVDKQTKGKYHAQIQNVVRKVNPQTPPPPAQPPA